jgi:hypothetical protein
MDTVISLGDVAKSNDAADAWWCVQALDWSDMALRRQVIAALMPSVERATKHTSNKRVYDCVAVIHDWIAGKPADLNSAATWAEAATRAALATWAEAVLVVAAAEAATWAALAEAATRAEVAAAEAALAEAEVAAAEAARAVAAARAARAAARAAAEAAAGRGAEAAWWEAGAEEERETQRQDHIAAFPPLIRKD